MGADRVAGRHGLLELALLREGQARDRVQASGRTGRVDPGFPELLAVEGRALEEVLELRAVALAVDGELLFPAAGLDLGVEDHDAGGR